LLGWDVDFSGFGIEFEFYLHVVARGDARRRAHVAADADEVPAGPDSDGGAVGVSVDGHPDRRTLAAGQRGDEVGGNLDAGCRLSGELDRGVELHGGGPHCAR
jgi:hypothetical protein